jgi:hypothetical protein
MKQIFLTILLSISSSMAFAIGKQPYRLAQVTSIACSDSNLRIVFAASIGMCSSFDVTYFSNIFDYTVYPTEAEKLEFRPIGLSFNGQTVEASMSLEREGVLVPSFKLGTELQVRGELKMNGARFPVSCEVRLP